MAIDKIGHHDSVNQIKDLYRNLDKSKNLQTGDISFKELLAAEEAGKPQSTAALKDSVEISGNLRVDIPPEANGNRINPGGGLNLRSVAEKAVRQASDVRQDRVEKLSTLISKGEYHIPASVVADSLIASHIFDDLI